MANVGWEIFVSQQDLLVLLLVTILSHLLAAMMKNDVIVELIQMVVGLVTTVCIRDIHVHRPAQLQNLHCVLILK